jgi:hypothetical protein
LEALQREWGNSVQPLKKADTSATYPFGAINFIPALGINFQISKKTTRGEGAVTLKGSLWMGDETDFSENLPNEPTFSQVHLYGLYL